MENIALFLFTLFTTTRARACKYANARALAIARSYAATLGALVASTSPLVAGTNFDEVVIEAEIEDEELQFYRDGTLLDDELIDDGGSIEFRDALDGSAIWELELVVVEGPNSAIACQRISDAIECMYNGLDELRLIFEATNQQTEAKKRKVIKLDPPPETLPADAQTSR